jgi:hypothetical protein
LVNIALANVIYGKKILKAGREKEGKCKRKRKRDKDQKII